MKRLLASAFVFVIPAIAFGQQRIGSLFQEILNFFAGVVSFLGPVLIAIALLAFFWSLINYLFRRDEAPNSGKYLGFSILILFVMVSIWGIISFLQQNLGIGDGRDLYNTPGVDIDPFTGRPNNR
jgi:hypothetical protein